MTNAPWPQHSGDMDDVVNHQQSVTSNESLVARNLDVIDYAEKGRTNSDGDLKDDRIETPADGNYIDLLIAHKQLKKPKLRSSSSLAAPVNKKNTYRFISHISNPRQAPATMRRPWKQELDHMPNLLDSEFYRWIFYISKRCL